MPPPEIVVDGTDSGGKTPCVEALYRALAADRDVRTCAPFRVQEVYPLWEREPRRAAAVIRAIMDDLRRASAAADVIIWDRGWPTVWVSTTDPAARAALLPFPDLTVLLLNSMETTIRKAEKHGLRSIWVSDRKLVRRYHDAYHALPGEVKGGHLATFFPAPDGRYDYATICTNVCDKLKLDRKRSSFGS
jgi:thymidylate kinase